MPAARRPALRLVAALLSPALLVVNFQRSMR
jgi:hypothetical protein